MNDYDENVLRPLFGIPRPRECDNPKIMSGVLPLKTLTYETEVIKHIQTKKYMDRVRNLVVGILTGMLVLITLIMAFLRPCIFPSLHDAVNIFFSVIILMICGSHITLIIWYREGNLEPAFRKMIYFNTFTIVMLCICGNLYINGVGLNYQMNCTGTLNTTTPRPTDTSQSFMFVPP